MTLLNASVSEHHAILSSDSFRYLECDTSKLSEFYASEEYRTGQFKPAGNRPTRPETASQCSKIHALPHMSSLVGGAGSEALIISITAALIMAPVRDISFMCQSIVPHVRRQISSIEAMTEQHHARIVIVGWSDREQRFMGFVLQSETSYEPIELPCNNPLLGPQPNLSKEMKASLAWGFGQDLESDQLAHHKILKLQHQTYMEGGYPEIFHCDSDFVIASATKDGLVIKQGGGAKK